MHAGEMCLGFPNRNGRLLSYDALRGGYQRRPMLTSLTFLLPFLWASVITPEQEDAKGCICPPITPRCMPPPDEGCPLECIDSTTLEYADCCCTYTYITEWDFYRRYPKLSGPAADWSYYTKGNFTADGGSLVFGRRGGLLNSNVYTTTSFPGPVPYLDNYKYLVFADESIELNSDKDLVIEFQVDATTFLTGASPYPAVLLKCPGDDVRLAAASFNVYDPVTELSFNFVLTNDMVYAMYSRSPDRRIPGTYNYAAFTFLVPLRWRQPTDEHRLRVVLSQRTRTVRWKVEENEVFVVENIGARLDRQYMTADFGGADDSVFPAAVLYGFGSQTLLNHYPACWRACENKPCTYPAVRMALLNTGNSAAPAQYDPVTAAPNPAEFWNDGVNNATSFRLWGQGSISHFKRIAVYEQKCKRQILDRCRTVTATVTMVPTRGPQAAVW